MQIEAGKYYRTRDGRKAEVLGYRPDSGVLHPFYGAIGSCARSWASDGKWLYEDEDPADLIAEWTDEDDTPETYVEPEDYAAVPVRDDWSASDADVQDEDILAAAAAPNEALAAAAKRVEGIITPGAAAWAAAMQPSIKEVIADEAKRIVTGARRAAYGPPEDNFARIARFWTAYFQNTGRDLTITPADVSPLMRLMKEARLCETPDHYDSHVDLVGYALTGAEVAKVKQP